MSAGAFTDAAARLDRVCAEIEAGAKRGQANAVAMLADHVRAVTPIETGRLRESIEAHPDHLAVTAPYSSLLEFGTSRITPQPFVRPGVAAGRTLVGPIIAEAVRVAAVRAVGAERTARVK